MKTKTSSILILAILLFCGAADSYVSRCSTDLSQCCTATYTLTTGSVAYGVNCWEFGETHPGWDENDFICDATVQINPGNKPCLVTCRDNAADKCGCALSAACIDQCSDTIVGTCKRTTFSCSGHQSYLCSAGGALSVDCRDTIECQSACAKECGRATSCSQSCSTCCNQTQCNNPSYTKVQRDACIDACSGLCKANEEVCNVAKLLQLITGLVAVSLLIINAIWYIISDDPAARTSARHGMWYVIFGLIVAAAAFVLVGLFTGVSIASCSLLS